MTRAGLYVAMIFLSGLLVGGTLMNLAEHDWFHVEQRNEYDITDHARVAAEMQRRLDLTEQQRQEVNQILMRTVRRYRQVELDVEPRFDAVRAQGRAQLRAILSDPQRVTFDHIVRQVDARYPMDERPASIPTPCPMPIPVH
ncbi:MAG: hypothetical protein ACRD13_09485 [Terriglobales bacterium]